MQKDTKSWFASWFDSPFYHILYKDRDESEAALFMETLTSFLKLKPKAEMLDLACGKGRHAQHLNKIGFDVTGVDLSPESITHAKQSENDSLHFAVHDMCIPYPAKFDAVFNLFTSFGYFENEEDNLKTIQAIKASLKPGGFGVIDFLNADLVVKNIVKSETKIVDDIVFHIRRKMENGFILKNIKFSCNNENFEFTERVKALSYSDFTNYFNQANCNLLYSFGDYNLQPFSESTSERLILIFN